MTAAMSPAGVDVPVVMPMGAVAKSDKRKAKDKDTEYLGGDPEDLVIPDGLAWDKTAEKREKHRVSSAAEGLSDGCVSLRSGLYLDFNYVLNNDFDVLFTATKKGRQPDYVKSELLSSAFTCFNAPDYVSDMITLSDGRSYVKYVMDGAVLVCCVSEYNDTGKDILTGVCVGDVDVILEWLRCLWDANCSGILSRATIADVDYDGLRDIWTINRWLKDVK
jgi:hypothetical protein